MLWIPIDRSLEVPLFRQVYEQIRRSILKGALKSGEKLASTRGLSSELGVSRNVVLEAYELLYAEGYLTSEPGSGTFVAEGIYLNENEENLSSDAFNWVEEKHDDHNIIRFRSGIPALDLIPNKAWAKLAHAIWREAIPSTLGYGDPEGRPELRNALAHYLLKTRGVQCRPEQIVITSGATQAMTLVSKLFLTLADEVVIEDPITNDIQTIFKVSGASLYPIPVDEFGMQTSLLPVNRKPKFVFVTPSHQFPLGGVLPIQRRTQLINYSRENDCYLVEDDYDSEFRYEGSPISSLQGLAPERVVYIGSFSKTLSPALRMGYLILPPNLVEKCRGLKWFSDLHTPAIDQLILARFITEGYLEKHISKVKKVYKQRRDICIQCLQTTFSNEITIRGHSTGLHLIAEFKNVQFTKDLLESFYEFGVEIYPVEDHTIVKGNYDHCVILGFGHLTIEEIEEGVARLGKAINSSYKKS